MSSPSSKSCDATDPCTSPNVTEELVESVLLIYIPLISALYFFFNGFLIVEDTIIRGIVLFVLVLWSVMGMLWVLRVGMDRLARDEEIREK